MARARIFRPPRCFFDQLRFLPCSQTQGYYLVKYGFINVRLLRVMLHTISGEQDIVNAPFSGSGKAQRATPFINKADS